MAEESKKRSRWVVAFLVLVPTYLIVSGIVAIWGNLKVREKESQQERTRFAKLLSGESMRDDYQKLTEQIGVRTTDEKGARGLSAAASWIEGSLGPSNTGYEVRKTESGTGKPWPILHVTLRGRDASLPDLWIASTFVSDDGVAGSSAVVAEMAIAQVIANQPLPRTVHFAFLPLSKQDGSDKVLETFTRLVRQGHGGEVLWLENFGTSSELWISAAPENERILNLAKQMGHGLEWSPERIRGDYEMLVSTKLMVSRVSTAAPEVNERVAQGDALRIASGRMLDLIRQASSPVQKK